MLRDRGTGSLCDLGKEALRALGTSLLLHERRCTLCRAVHTTGSPFCEACRAVLTRPAPGHCPRCGQLYAAPSIHICGNCLKIPPPWEGFAMIGPYQGRLRELLLRAKFHADNAALHGLGVLMAESACTLPLPAAIVPVPLHPARLRQRGFNQSLELARPVARALNVPLRGDLLLRQVDTIHQRGLSAEARRKNLRGAFVSGAAQGLRVWLVDDVATTGTTLRQAVATLVHAGAVVDVLVAARA